MDDFKMRIGLPPEAKLALDPAELGLLEDQIENWAQTQKDAAETFPDETEAYPQCLGREFERLAVTHLQAAQIMARSGIIPDQLHALVLDHHLPALLPVTQLECSAEHAKNLCILFLANQVAKLVSPDGTLLDDVRRLDQFDPSYREIISKAEARQILLSPGLVRDVLSNVHVVQAMLN